VDRLPSHFFFIFSGHGSDISICLADGALAHEDLAGYVNALGAPSSAVVIDACHAGAVASRARFDGLGELPDEPWQAVLAEMVPGVRLLLSSRADQVSSDGAARNGTFTQGLLEAVRKLPGDIHVPGRSYVSAEAAFGYAARFVQVHTLGRQTPVGSGPTADFPIAVSRQPALIQLPSAPAPNDGPSLGSILFWGGVAALGVYAWSRRSKRRSGRRA
jgi:hypothetical protein